MGGLVYSYMRFSDPRQASGHSSERQMAYAAKWAAEHGLALDDSLSLRDEGLSAYHQRHVKSGALGVFLAAVEQGRIPLGSVLVVEGLDRLSRAEPIQAQAQLAQIVNAGITVVTASDGKAYSREHLKANPMDLVYSLLVMIRAHEESDTKSKRVTASIRRLCQGWMAGSYRGLVRNGKDPLWLRWDGEAWHPIPERVAAARRAIELYVLGYGATAIIRKMQDEGLSITGTVPQTLQIYRLVKQRALRGEKELTVDGEEFRLQGYYPAILSDDEWLRLESIANSRVRQQGKGVVPHVLTGLGITKCGYCGRAMVGQNIGTRRKNEGDPIADGLRRLHCTSYSHGGCQVSGTTSVAPFERALMAYCSDIVNLQALYGADRSAGPRGMLAQAKQRLADIDQKLTRLTNAILESSEEGTPLTFARRARELEAEQLQAKAAVAAAERELASVARSNTSGADQLWSKLAKLVEAQDIDARYQTRQLIADTFERIVIYHQTIKPSTPDSHGYMDMMLIAKGGNARILRINKQGALISAEDVHELAEPPI